VRKVGLSQQGIAMPDSQSWMYPDINAPTDDSQTLPTRWLSYISAESLRLSLYSLVFLDSHTFSLYNTRPLISPMEFSWELPFPSNLWEAKNPQIWLENFNDYFETSPHRMTDASWHTLRGLSTASLTIATQQIMTETPSPELLIALQASPFATFCLLANLGALLRDFTRCYYQMPSTLSDPNPFHVLTKQQNEQFHMGIQAIAKIVKDQAYTSDNFYSIQGRTIQLFMSSLRINLCRPDELLIGGIVDTNLIDGMIASTYLAQGNFVAIRRSAPLTPRHIGGDESILALLNDLCGAISLISLKEPQKWVHEAPWATVASYGILLCVWGALRRTSADIRQHLESFNELPRTSESCMLIFSTLMDSALVNSSVANNNRPWCLDRETFDSLLEEGESLFVSSMRDFCKQRHLWGIGPSMLAVLGEIPTGTNSGPG
jgi:hypothetical protein